VCKMEIDKKDIEIIEKYCEEHKIIEGRGCKGGIYNFLEYYKKSSGNRPKKDFLKEGEHVLIDALIKYEKKKDKYDESWKTMSIEQLRSRMREEYSEWMDVCSLDAKAEYGEVLDILNMCLMLGNRLRYINKENVGDGVI